MIRTRTALNVFGKMQFLLISESWFFDEIKYNKMTSFMDFMQCEGQGQWQLQSGTLVSQHSNVCSSATSCQKIKILFQHKIQLRSSTTSKMSIIQFCIITALFDAFLVTYNSQNLMRVIHPMDL